MKSGRPSITARLDIARTFTFGMVYSGLTRTYNKFPFTEILAGRT
jgi:hypothetical protein